MRLLVTGRAELSLNEIIEFYLIEFTVERTQKVIDSIDTAFITIAKSPLHYPVCFDIKFPQENIRQFILHNTFKIIYRIQPDCIEIIEIFHGKRNPDEIKDIQ